MIKIFKKNRNLFSIIEKQSKIIENNLSNRKDLELIEKFPHVWKNKKEKFTLTSYWGKPIWHSKTEVFLWHKFVIRGFEAEKKLKEILQTLKLEPFKDPKYFPTGFHFNNKTKTVSCYVNLDFPQGYKQKINMF